MARIVITIEDLPGNKVKVEVHPNVAEIFNIDPSGGKLTSAHGYAMKAVNAIREAARQNHPNMDLFIPRRG